MELEDCRTQNHRFQVVGSDKTPMKRSLMCVTCTNANPGKSAYVAYGDPLKSWGQWRTQMRPKEEFHEDAEDGELQAM